MMTRLRGYYLIALVASVAVLLVSLLVWGVWSLGSGVVSVTEWVVKPTVTETAEPTPPEPTPVPTGVPTKAKVVVKEVVVAVTATSQPKPIEPTAEPTALPTGVAILEAAPNSCGYTLPADWLESSDLMTTSGQTRVFQMNVPAGQVSFIWGTTVRIGETSLTRGLVLIKGPFIGDMVVSDGAGRIGKFNDMSDEGLAKAMAHIQMWLECSYGSEGWQPPLWVPANQ